MPTRTDIDTIDLNIGGCVRTCFAGFDGAYQDRAASPISRYDAGTNGAFTHTSNKVFCDIG
jgi:hypothetical protein